MAEPSRGRVRFFNRFYWPDESATAQLLTDVAEHLAGQGYPVEVVTSRLLYGGAKGDRLLEEATVQEGVHIRRLWSTSFGRGSLPGRLLDYLTIYLSFLFFLLFRTRRGDLVVVKTDPPLLSILGWLGRSLRSFKLVSWCQDVFPEVAEHSLGTSALLRPLYGFLKWLRNGSLKRSDTVVVLSGDMEAYLREQGVEAPFATIPNWAIQAPRTSGRSCETFRKEWGLEGRFVLGYSGNLGRAHETATLLKALPRLQELEDLTLLFIGGGAGYEQLKADTAAFPEAFIRFLPYQAREDLSETLKVPHIHWFSLVPEMVPFVFPSKFYGILESGRPVIFVGDPACELSRTIEGSGCGCVVAPGDGEGLVAAVEKLHADAHLRNQLGKTTQRLSQEDFSRPRRLEDWGKLVENLLECES